MSLLKALDLSGNWERAILLFESVVCSDLGSEWLQLDREVIELMARVLERESQHTMALNLFDSIAIEEYSLDIRAYTTILYAYSQSRKYERAVKLFGRAMGMSPTLVTYNVMLDVYEKMGRSHDKILSLLDAMKARGLRSMNSLVARRAIALPTRPQLVAAYVRAGFYQEGVAFVDVMVSKKIMPHAITYTTLIDAYGKAGKEEKALDLFNGMKKFGCVPNICTYNDVLRMLGKKFPFEEMIVVLDDMKASGCSPNVFREMKSCGFEPDRDTFNILISAYGRYGSEINATKMFGDMIKVGFTPCITTYNALLNALAWKGDWRVAELVILDMKMKGFKPNETSYSLMVNCYAKGGKVKGDCWKAEEVLGRIQSLGRTPDLISYNTVTKGFCRQGLMQEAIRIFSEMSGRGIRPCIVTYNTFISGYAAREMFAEIDDVVEYMFQHGYRLNELTCKIIVNGYCKAVSSSPSPPLPYSIQWYITCKPKMLKIPTLALHTPTTITT
ncbi:hypothetical protein SAY87_009511 [Trapa incisa]|uniref:Pentatricopeptide repeat-containing protein n=1 Tax=Trapa incisa TaxID=236973 RepID=A0AAN7JYH0_9MYRT|nr:hypothetical protein SAY87_009511 [Trapa incisa]